MENIKQLLNEKEKTHENFAVAAIDFETLQMVIYDAENLSTSHKYALNMIMLNITRIIHGDPSQQDHWRDIASYALLGGELRG
ncbi:hypothetical protein SAMN05660772_02065 [Pasteurella testudinis DSM 23072]|uniref:Uncharacterized protein n=1 Tax=Pasteurella testudinis DSM 23072 TaxID=1122938 RepID=A0A1W1UNG0_9PAST|nr:hypothetical protein [Pasteurella testudinis]SMB82341.1 hypothetical protein SAMN05660772_02065 [Pasteurella testudinis DSM 23072]SUB52249.1 Uncharacterised protein [Pasteurella testudinis]